MTVVMVVVVVVVVTVVMVLVMVLAKSAVLRCAAIFISCCWYCCWRCCFSKWLICSLFWGKGLTVLSIVSPCAICSFLTALSWVTLLCWL